MSSTFDHWMFRLMGVLTAVLFCSACGTQHEGSIGWVDQTPAINKDVEIERSVTGSASNTYYLGIIGTSKMNVYDRARRDLLEKADLEEDEWVINRTVDEVTSSFLPTEGLGIFTPMFLPLRLYYSKTVYLSGEVVELDE